jgi:hypothetical protein
MKMSFRRASVLWAAATMPLLVDAGFSGSASASVQPSIIAAKSASATVISSAITVTFPGHGTEWDYYLVNLESVSFDRPGTRGYSGWELSVDPKVPAGGKFFVYNSDTGEVPAVLDPSRKDQRALYEVSDWKDVAFSYYQDHVEVRYGDYQRPKESLIIASASRYGWLADRTNEKFTGHGATTQDAMAAAEAAMAQFERDHNKECQLRGSVESQDGQQSSGLWTVVMDAECG